MIKYRRVPKTWPERILFESTDRYFDTETGSFVAIKMMKSRSRSLNMALIYVMNSQGAKMITVFPERATEVKKRVLKGRYEEI